MSKELTIEQVANGFIVRQVDINHQAHHAAQGEPYVFSSQTEMFAWMSTHFTEDDQEAHSEK